MLLATLGMTGAGRNGHLWVVYDAVTHKKWMYKYLVLTKKKKKKKKKKRKMQRCRLKRTCRTIADF